MKKRIVTLLTALILLVGLLVVPSMATEDATAEFMAGYAAVDITPAADAGLPLWGYGYIDNLYTSIEKELYVTAIAMTDKYGTSALLISVDTFCTSQLWSNEAKNAIIEEVKKQNDIDVDYDRIYISATTTMSAPELVYTGSDPDIQARVEAYKATVIAACATASSNAFTDQTAVTMYHNDMDASEGMVHLKSEAGVTVTDGDLVTRMNYNNHYNVVSKTDANETYVAGNNFGPTAYLNNSNYAATEVAQPDDTMGLLIFKANDGSKQDIVLANWSAKPNITSSGTNMYGVYHSSALSSDYVGYFRDKMAQSNMRTAFFQGTSGNVSPFPLVAAQRNPDMMEQITYTTEDAEGNSVEKTANSVTPKAYGELLAQLAIHGATHVEGENHLHAADMDAPISNLKIRFAVEPNVPTETQIELVNLLKTTEVPTSAVEADPSLADYENLYEYLIGQWDTAKPLAVQALTEAGKTELAAELNAMFRSTQLFGVAARMRHTVNGGSTNFATEAVRCDATVLQLGKMTFVMAPAELYSHYGSGAENAWDAVGAHFVIGNTNGASGNLPDAASYHYNETNDAYMTGTPNAVGTTFPEGAGELLMESYVNVKKTMTATVDDSSNQIRMQCECGGLAEGKPDHTCEVKAFYPWYDPDSLPVSGNYYLMTDITLLEEARTGTAQKSIDLNGHTITRKVLPEYVLDETGPEVPEENYYVNTRLFALEQNARLTITDSVGGGKLTRDISALDAISADEQKKIHNYGLLVAIIDGNTSEFILYNGILDATGQYSGGGACVANMSKTATFTMYDGQLLGGVSDRGAAVYANGTNKFYGGSITGGEVRDTAGDEDTNADKNGNVNLVGGGKLLLAGNTTISGGKRGEEDCNLVIKDSNSLTVDENYTGTAGVSVTADDPNGSIIGWLENVPESAFDNFTVDNYPTYEVMLCNSNAVTIGEIRNYCVCGGKAVGKHDHTCQDIQWKPWPTAYNGYLPNSNIGGNYYLLTDISLKEQKIFGKETHLDLNGHNVTLTVNPGDKTLKELNDTGTRVFYIAAGGSLTLTDSTANPGTVKRDLSLLSEEQKAGITNYGIIVLMNDESTGDFVLYDGILDATGQITGGGAVANLQKELAIRIYGGEIKGGITSNGGCIYSQGAVWLHGGKLSGGQSTQTTGAGGIIITSTGSLYLCGDATVTGNTNAAGEPADIKVSTAEQFTVEDDFVGEAGVILNAKPSHLMKVAKSNAVDLTVATITPEKYTEGFELRVVDGYIVTYMHAAYITYEDETPVTYHYDLQGAFNAYPGGKATITLQRDVAEDSLTITKNTYLDLAGWDITENTGFTADGVTLYVFDSETDDYTIANGNGYGIMQGDIAQAAEGLPLDSDIVTAVKPTDHYLKIEEAGSGTSFHRLNLRFAGVTFRPDSMKDGTYWPGMYYNSQFGGDEVIKRNITSYGVGMSAIEGEEMFTRDGSWTQIDAANWQAGADANGNSKNVTNGTILTGIMKTSNVTMINRRNGTRQVRGQNYILMTDGTRVVGPEISYSVQDLFEGNNITGLDDNWESWDDATKANILRIYNTYESVLKHWDLPNIKAAAASN